MEELEQIDWISEAQAIDWRAVTIATAARLVGRDKEARANQMKKDNLEMSGTTRMAETMYSQRPQT